MSTNLFQNFRIEIFHTGYYQGRGARLIATYNQLAGKAQQVPEYGPKRLRVQMEALEIKIPGGLAEFMWVD